MVPSLVIRTKSIAMALIENVLLLNVLLFIVYVCPAMRILPYLLLTIQQSVDVDAIYVSIITFSTQNSEHVMTIILVCTKGKMNFIIGII